VVAEQTSGARPPVFYPGYERMWRVLRTVGCRCSCTGKDAQARAIAELLDGVNPWSLRPGRQVWGDAHATSPNGIDTFYDSTVEQFALQPLEVLSLRQVCLVRGMRQHFVMYINAHLPPVVVQHQQTLLRSQMLEFGKGATHDRARVLKSARHAQREVRPPLHKRWERRPPRDETWPRYKKHSYICTTQHGDLCAL